MQFENVFLIGSFFVYIIIFLSIFIYIKKSLKKYGFNVVSFFTLTFTLFYLTVPFVQTYFKSNRNHTSLFAQMLNLKSDNELFLNFLIVSFCLLIVLVSYHTKIKKTNKKKKSEEIKNISNNTYKKILIINNIIFVIGILSITLLILEVGSISNYLALGAFTRGVDTNPTQFVRPIFLQLITLSAIILVPPYIYLFLYRVKKSKEVLTSFALSFLFAMLYLFYNQGRAPLIIFILPFIFSLRKKRSKNLLGLAVLFIIGIFSLRYLNGIFNYLSYDVFYVDNNINYISEFLGEFSYPFANFTLRKELIDFTGFRYFYDYIIWPFTMIPSSVLDLVGINKESIISIGELNTAAYGSWLGVTPSGGIPVDLLTFNYYQLGSLSLVAFCIIIGKLLKKLDTLFNLYKNNFSMRIILYRLSFSMINILNNADISAIVRNRLDVVVVLVIFIYITHLEKKNNISFSETDKVHIIV